MPQINKARLLLAVLLLLPAAPAIAQPTGEPTPGVTPAPAEPAAEKAPTVDITARSQQALSELDRLRSEIDALGDSAAETERVKALRARVNELLPEGWSVEDLADHPALIDGVLVRSRALTSQSNELINELTSNAKALEQRLSTVRAMIASWETTLKEGTDLPDALVGRVNEILSTARGLEQQIAGKLNTVIELQDASISVRNVITPIAQRIDSFGASRQMQMFEQNAAPVWAITRENLGQSSERSTRLLTGSFRRDFVSWAETSEAAIGSHLLLLPIILVLLFWLKRTADHPSSALARPVATGVLIWMLIGVAIYASAPAAVRTVFVVVAMLVATVVLLNFVPRQMRKGVLIFVAVALIHEFVQRLPITDHLPRVMYLAIAGALAVIAWRARTRGVIDAIREWGAPRALVSGAVTGAFVASVISALSNAAGFVALAQTLVVGVVDSTAVFLVLFAGFSSLREIVQIVLGLPALNEVRSIANNRHRLNRVLRQPLVWLSLFLWGWVVLRSFGIDGWFFASLRGIFRAEMSLGEVTLSLRGIVVFVLAVWVAVWASRIVRAVLNQDVLPRMELPRGVPNTISMTAHYSIILFGLLIGIGFLGIDLSSMAFIVGALGVGIGFGLQNLVNNFVSGLILIFEAPIQVGDTVEVGNLMGRVTQIGIRTSRVRTYGGSEVIVPNGDLVSNQVVNWTLSDRRRRLELAVGVAYGTDPQRVTEILRGVLEADEEVLDDPAPLIIFNEFGDSSLNFRIYAWIADFDTGFTMTHRLNTAINAALADAGISIPFPQRDLHVKTLPKDLDPNPEPAT